MANPVCAVGTIVRLNLERYWRLAHGKSQRPKRPKVRDGQAKTSERGEDMEGGTHPQTGYAEKAGEAGEEGQINGPSPTFPTTKGTRPALGIA